ncbi:MAG: MATE family efflux transporter [Ruminococcus sp.]|jgi:putative MATE family efflux protein|nr:MATE family efflux transporter [Ruminococcus sp.]
MNKDLTNGKPFSLIWRFVLPMLFSIIFQQMYNLSDSIIAGKFIGENALSAIGASYPVTMLFLQVANGLNSGTAVIVSQLFGAKKMVRLKNAMSTALITATTLSAVLTLTGVIACRPILSALETPAGIMSDSALYLNIYFYGMFFVFIYNICNGIFTALGDSKTPLYFLIFSSLLNIGLSVMFVTVIDFGLAGIAWATFVAQGVAMVLAFTVLMRRIHKMRIGVTTLGVKHRVPKFSWRTFRKLMLISIPAILQLSFVSVGNIFVQSVINKMGESAIAGFSVGFRLSTFGIVSMGTAANGLASFTAQNIGAGKPERVPQGFKAGSLLSLIFVAPFVAAYLIIPQFMVNIFIENPETSSGAIAIATTFLRTCAIFYPVLAFKLVCDAILRGAGAMKTFMIATFADLLLRVLFVYILTPFIGYYGLGIAFCIGWVIATIISLIFYKQGRWRRHAL